MWKQCYKTQEGRTAQLDLTWKDIISPSLRYSSSCLKYIHKLLKCLTQHEEKSLRLKLKANAFRSLKLSVNRTSKQATTV